MSKNHDDIDQDTTAEAADSLKAWLSTPTQGDTQEETADAPTSEAETNPAHQPPHQDADSGHDQRQAETPLP